MARVTELDGRWIPSHLHDWGTMGAGAAREYFAVGLVVFPLQRDVFLSQQRNADRQRLLDSIDTVVGRKTAGLDLGRLPMDLVAVTIHAKDQAPSRRGVKRSNRAVATRRSKFGDASGVRAPGHCLSPIVRKNGLCCRAAASSSTPTGDWPSMTPRIPRPGSVWATTPCTGLAVAPKIPHPSGTA
jgi:hypothetical protein